MLRSSERSAPVSGLVFAKTLVPDFDGSPKGQRAPLARCAPGEAGSEP
jgi:hypothetical protein